MRFLGLIIECTGLQQRCETAVGQMVMALGCDVAAILQGGTVLASAGPAPDEGLEAIATTRSATADLPGVGPCHLRTEAAGDITLLIARVGPPMADADLSLLRVFAQVMVLALSPVPRVQAHTDLHDQQQDQAVENARLLKAAAQRQAVTERMYRIQRAIALRRPVHRVMQSIVDSVAETIGDEVVVLRLVEEDGNARVVASVGLPKGVLAGMTTSPGGTGLLGQVLLTDGLVVAEDYSERTFARPELLAAGLRSAMGAPFRADGVTVGALLSASGTPRRYSPFDRTTLLAFADHASIALNDDRASHAMRDALDDAVHQAHHDALTGLPNRKAVIQRLQEALAANSSGREVAVMFIDLDRFKAINDSHGHEIGDRVLDQVAARLRTAVGVADTVGRLSGDEFVVLVDGVPETEVVAMANRILANVATPMQIAGRELGVTASVGVTRSRPGDTAESLLGDADLAMYEAKQRGRSRLQVYDRNMTARVRRNADIEQALRRAIRLQELRLHYQPIIDLRTGRVRSIEALARWERPDIGMVPPDVFIPIAEETGMILPIGEWVLRTACADLRRLRDRDPAHRDLTVNVNLSARQLNQTDIAGMVHDALQGNGLTGQALVLELTESALMGRDDAEVRALGALEALGVKLSMDDFGTGYSSLLYLKRFRVGQLKVDRQFVSGLGTGGEDDAIVRAIVGLAQALQIDVVAEGVETDRQIRHLTEAGCSIAQGYRLGRPVAVGQLDLTPVSLGRLTPREGTLP